MNETDLNTAQIESFFNFGNPTPDRSIQEKQIPTPTLKPNISLPVTEERKNNIPNFTAVTARETVRESIRETAPENERSGMTYLGEVPNHPTRKSYPERTFDKFVKKDARLEESDLEMLKAWANKISHVKRKTGQNSGSSNRITDNTILRLILTEFCDKLVITFKDPSYKEVLTEEELRAVILNTMEKR
jgi:hypothetical protein